MEAMSFLRFSSASFGTGRRLEKRRVRSWFSRHRPNCGQQQAHSESLPVFQEQQSDLLQYDLGFAVHQRCNGHRGRVAGSERHWDEDSASQLGGGDWMPFVPTPSAPLPAIVDYARHDRARCCPERWKTSTGGQTRISFSGGRLSKLHHASQRERGREAKRKQGRFVDHDSPCHRDPEHGRCRFRSEHVHRSADGKECEERAPGRTFRPRGIAVCDKPTPDRRRNQQRVCHRQHKFLTEQRAGRRNWPNQPFRSATDYALGVDCSAPLGDLPAKRMDRFALHFVRRYGGEPTARTSTAARELSRARIFRIALPGWKYPVAPASGSAATRLSSSMKMPE